MLIISKLLKKYLSATPRKSSMVQLWWSTPSYWVYMLFKLVQGSKRSKVEHPLLQRRRSGETRGAMGCITCNPYFLGWKGQDPPWTLPLFKYHKCLAPLDFCTLLQPWNDTFQPMMLIISWHEDLSVRHPLIFVPWSVPGIRYHPTNDADNLVTRKLSASKPLEVKASVLHILLLANGASLKWIGFYDFRLLAISLMYQRYKINTYYW